MSSFRQIEANRRNARLSTGPVTEEGKKRSRQNAVRHGLTAETVITALEDAEDYASFEMAVTTDYHVQTAVERELVLRLASLLWRLRRANTIEAGLFTIQARQLLKGQQSQSYRPRQKFINSIYRNAVATEVMSQEQATPTEADAGLSTTVEDSDRAEDLTHAFVRLNNMPTCPLDRLSRYEATLWRQACQILWTLQCLDRRKPWERLRRA